jgi:hypothetical protein
MSQARSIVTLVSLSALTGLMLTATAAAHPPDEHGNHAHTAAASNAAASVAFTGPRYGGIVGSGAHRYEAVIGWGTPPDDRPFGNTHGGVVVDKKGRVYFNTDTERSGRNRASTTIIRARTTRRRLRSAPTATSTSPMDTAATGFTSTTRSGVTSAVSAAGALTPAHS